MIGEPAPPRLRYGFILPGGNATEQLEQAVIADQAGWDGVFVWEAAFGVDAWTLLAAMAQRTSRVRLGTMLTPLPWRRPWKVASQVAIPEPVSGSLTPDGIPAIRAWLREQGGVRPGFDIVTEGETPADPEVANRMVAPSAEAGCTWWLESRWEMPHHSPERMRQVRERLEAGPPQLG